MRKGGVALVIAFLVLLFLIVVLVAQVFATEYTVVRVLDGDTLDIAAYEPELDHLFRPVRVRLIGVNTPELRHPMPAVHKWAVQAWTDVRDLTEVRPKVRLAWDQDEQDAFGRQLVYLWVTWPWGDAPAIFLNAWLLEKGLAWVGDPGKNRRYHQTFLRLQAEAKTAQRGIWASE